jgi:hypothetical protein
MLPWSAPLRERNIAEMFSGTRPRESSALPVQLAMGRLLIENDTLAVRPASTAMEVASLSRVVPGWNVAGKSGMVCAASRKSSGGSPIAGAARIKKRPSGVA